MKKQTELTQHIKELGFKENTKPINGFIPHFRKGNDLLFLIGADFKLSKICKINHAFKDHEGDIYGILTPQSPAASKFDWFVSENLTLISVNPTSIAKWNKYKTDIEFVELEGHSKAFNSYIICSPQIKLTLDQLSVIAGPMFGLSRDELFEYYKGKIHGKHLKIDKSEDVGDFQYLIDLGIQAVKSGAIARCNPVPQFYKNSNTQSYEKS